jgi:hypothetical protein
MNLAIGGLAASEKTMLAQDTLRAQDPSIDDTVTGGRDRGSDRDAAFLLVEDPKLRRQLVYEVKVNLVLDPRIFEWPRAPQSPQSRFLARIKKIQIKAERETS